MGNLSESKAIVILGFSHFSHIFNNRYYFYLLCITYLDSLETNQQQLNVSIIVFYHL